MAGSAVGQDKADNCPGFSGYSYPLIGPPDLSFRLAVSVDNVLAAL